MACPKCGCNNVKVKGAVVESLGMETIKGTLEVGYWGFKVASRVTENFGHPGMLFSAVSRGVAGLIKEGADNVNTDVYKYHCPRCGYSWRSFK